MNHRHTCEWTPNPDGKTFACTQCDATTPACVNTDTRRGPHPTGTNYGICDPCLRTESYVLDNIHAALQWWTPLDAYREKSPIVFDLVRTTGTRTTEPTTPDTIHHQLTAWALRWATHTGGTNGEGIHAYLKSRHLWAAQNPDTSNWHQYRQDTRKLRHTARAITGLTPEKLHEKCMYCDSPVAQARADHQWHPLETGRTDTIQCTNPDCQTTWENRERFQMNVRHHIWALPEKHPDQLVTLDQARKIFPHIPRKTIRSWIDRNQLQPAAHTRHQQPLYKLGHIHTLATHRTNPNRPGPRPTDGKITA